MLGGGLGGGRWPNTEYHQSNFSFIYNIIGNMIRRKVGQYSYRIQRKSIWCHLLQKTSATDCYHWVGLWFVFDKLDLHPIFIKRVISRMGGAFVSSIANIRLFDSIWLISHSLCNRFCLHDPCRAFRMLHFFVLTCRLGAPNHVPIFFGASRFKFFSLNVWQNVQYLLGLAFSLRSL